MARLERAIELLERGDAKGAASEARKAKELATRSPTIREILGLEQVPRVGLFAR